MRAFAKKLLWRFACALGVVMTWSVLAPTLARADDWGCQVLLCVANPGGPEQYSQCVPPIEKLWAALRHGDPFPSCDFGSAGSQGSGATDTFAGAGYCREDLLYWDGPEQSELMCNAAGAINVQINGQLYTRVWWGAPTSGGTITEYYGSSSGSLQPETPYDPTQAARQFLHAQQRREDQDGGGN
jgi:hypothetical protein